ncbi:MAG: YihY/virulence factor BrkB family protein [Litorimonas sp.]
MANTDTHECCAVSPLGFSLKDWWIITRLSYEEISQDNVTIVSAGVAFFSMLAIFPMITAGLSIYGLFADPAVAQQQLYAISDILPADVWVLINDQVQAVTGSANKAIGIKIALGIVAALWAASAGIRAMIGGLNIAYGEVNSHGFIRNSALGVTFTIGAIMMMFISLAVIIGVPSVLEILKLDGTAASLTKYLPWGLLIFAFGFSCATLYRYGPCRRPAKLRWVMPGVIFAVISWVIISVGFSKFVAAFGTYNKTYGSLGAVIVLLVWLWLTNWVIIVGAEINGEMERHTNRDTTRGPDRPIGERGAAMADFDARVVRIETQQG